MKFSTAMQWVGIFYLTVTAAPVGADMPPKDITPLHASQSASYREAMLQEELNVWEIKSAHYSDFCRCDEATVRGAYEAIINAWAATAGAYNRGDVVKGRELWAAATQMHVPDDLKELMATREKQARAAPDPTRADYYYLNVPAGSAAVGDAALESMERASEAWADVADAIDAEAPADVRQALQAKANAADLRAAGANYCLRIFQIFWRTTHTPPPMIKSKLRTQTTPRAHLHP